jgi:hypothetical protein
LVWSADFWCLNSGDARIEQGASKWRPAQKVTRAVSLFDGQRLWILRSLGFCQFVNVTIQAGATNLFRIIALTVEVEDVSNKYRYFHGAHPHLYPGYLEEFPGKNKGSRLGLQKRKMRIKYAV